MRQKLAWRSERHHYGDDLMGRCVEGHASARLTQSDLIEHLLVSPRAGSGRDRRGEVPGSDGGFARRIVATEHQGSSLLRRLEPGKHETFPFQLNLDRRGVERRRLPGPDRLGRQKKTSPPPP